MLYLNVDVVIGRIFFVHSHVPPVDMPMIEGVATNKKPMRERAFNPLNEYYAASFGLIEPSGSELEAVDVADC